MTQQQQSRTARKNQPFRPCAVEMADDRRFEIRHPDFPLKGPSGRTVILYEEDEDFSILDLLLMIEIEMLSTNLSPA